jgi:G:T/U-mismatch repair DNA glycosylase
VTMTKVNLKPFIRHNLDVLFVALNPPPQSNSNRHYFSGKNSRFFKLLYSSGLIEHEVDKDKSDKLIFGHNDHNYKKSSFGVMDLVPNIVKSSSNRITSTPEHVDKFVAHIKKFRPRFVCIIYGKVGKAINRVRKTKPEILRDLERGKFDKILRDCPSVFLWTYFPNGNNISDEIKLRHFRMLREKL